MTQKRILLVEDNPLVGRMYVQLLGAHMEDCEVDLVCDGDEALSSLEDEQYDLVITDLGLPAFSGRELYIRARELHLRESRELPPFVFCSAVKDALDTVTEFCETNRNRKLLKPFSLLQMQETVNEVLSG
jgi:CheY-like chemotaxis protein